jgi:hypothetical protein
VRAETSTVIPTLTKFFTLDCFVRGLKGIPRCSTNEKVQIKNKKVDIKKTKKKLKLKPKMMSKTKIFPILTGTDCGDKECFVRHSILKNCVLYLQTNVTDCVIPCNLVGCKTETHHFMNCPIWECKFYPNATTTTPPTTTSESTSTTKIPGPFVPDETFFYSSVACNILVVFLLVSFVLWKLNQCLKKRRTVTQVTQSREPLLDNNDQYFTLGNGHDDDGSSNESVANAIVSDLVPITLNRSNYHDRVLDELGNFDDVPLDSQENTPETPLHNCFELRNRQSNYLTFKPLPKTPKVENETQKLAETQF